MNSPPAGLRRLSFDIPVLSVPSNEKENEGDALMPDNVMPATVAPMVGSVPFVGPQCSMPTLLRHCFHHGPNLDHRRVRSR